MLDEYSSTDAQGQVIDGVSFRTWASRTGQESFQYSYEIGNPTVRPITVWWEILQYLGLDSDGGLDLPPGVVIVFKRNAAGIPLEGDSHVDGDYGFTFSYARTLLASTDLPDIPPVTGVSTSNDANGNLVLSWSHPSPTALDGVEVRVYSQGNHYGTPYWFESPSTAGTIRADDLAPGLNGITLLATRFGLFSESVVIPVER